MQSYDYEDLVNGQDKFHCQDTGLHLSGQGGNKEVRGEPICGRERSVIKVKLSHNCYLLRLS